MPPIPSARSTPSFRKTSTSRGLDGLHPNTPVDKERDQDNTETGLTIVGETGYLPLKSRKKSTAEKISDTGFLLYTLEDSNKLPKILKPKKKVSKGSKRKKISTTDQNNNSIKDGQEVDMINRLAAIGANNGNSEDSGANDEGEFYNKYGLDLRRDFSKSFTCNCRETTKNKVIAAVQSQKGDSLHKLELEAK